MQSQLDLLDHLDNYTDFLSFIKVCGEDNPSTELKDYDSDIDSLDQISLGRKKLFVNYDDNLKLCQREPSKFDNEKQNWYRLYRCSKYRGSKANNSMDKCHYIFF